MPFWKFLREESGALVPVFGVSLVPMLALVGISIDLGNMTRAKGELQIAVDATALAINHNLNTATQASIDAKAAAVFATHVSKLENPDIDPVSFDKLEGRVDVTASAVYTPLVMHSFGFGPMEFTAHARTVVGDQELEVALVLDNSGSMSFFNRMQSLKTAANNLVTSVYAKQNANTRVKVALVPFSGAVNVGTNLANETWVDRTGKSPIHYQNFANQTFTRWDLFTQLGVPWEGCMEVRPGEHAVTDSEAKDLNGMDSYFVPMFAPDEPSGWTNSYVSDTCAVDPADGGSNAAKQSRTCKYAGKTPSRSTVIDSQEITGPNLWCRSKPIIPLTNTESTITTALTQMQPMGHTNINEGLMWGWRVLSPTAPFTDGAPYNTPNLRKYIVLMTDGDNWLTGNKNTHNKTEYSAYGYGSKQRLGKNVSGMNDNGVIEETLEDAMDDQLATACANAKSAGIAIYTVALEVEDEPTRQLLKDCASVPTMAFEVEDGAQLGTAFAQIARELGMLRLTQ